MNVENECLLLDEETGGVEDASETPQEEPAEVSVRSNIPLFIIILTHSLSLSLLHGYTIGGGGGANC